MPLPKLPPAAEDIGVIAEPEVTATPLDGGTPFLLLASDGVWEFISSQRAVEIVRGGTGWAGVAYRRCSLPRARAHGSAAAPTLPHALPRPTRPPALTTPTMPPRPLWPPPTSSGCRRGGVGRGPCWLCSPGWLLEASTECHTAMPAWMQKETRTDDITVAVVYFEGLQDPPGSDAAGGV